MRSDSIKKAKDGVSGGVFYLGLAVIGVLAIPAAVLLGLIAGVWTLTDKLTALLEDKEKALLLRLINAENEIGSTMALENFILGFRLGVRMILEALDEDDGSLLDPNKEE